jgi:hypothetical protein
MQRSSVGSYDKRLQMDYRVDNDTLHPGQKLLVAIWVALFGYMALMAIID